MYLMWQCATYSKASSWECFVAREEILNGSVVIVGDRHSTQCLVATFTAELSLTVGHRSDTATIHKYV